MTFKNFLDAIGNDAKAVFSWLGSAKGQATVATVEGTATAVTAAINPAAGAALSGVEALVNAGLAEVIKTEQLAAAAGAQTGTGAQKAAAVTTAVTPQIQSLLVSLGVASPTSAEIQAVGTALSTGLVGVLNSLPVPATTTPAA